MIKLTSKEASAIAELIELNLFDTIRNDTAIDGMMWLCSIVSLYNKIMEGLNDGQEMQDM